jgi:hypothetical protein
MCRATAIGDLFEMFDFDREGDPTNAAADHRWVTMSVRFAGGNDK